MTMIIERFWPLENQVMWISSLDGVKHSFAHTWENCYAMQITTGMNTFLESVEILG